MSVVLVLILSETLLRYSVASKITFVMYLLVPLLMIIFTYILFLRLVKKCLKFINYLIINFLSKFIYLSLVFFIIYNIKFIRRNYISKKYRSSFWYPYLLTLLTAPITLFEIFPFIFLLTTQFLFYELFRNRELVLLKLNGLSNLKMIKLFFYYLFQLVFLIYLFIITLPQN